MPATKFALFTTALGFAAALFVLVFGVDVSPGNAGDELQEELVPGLDLWSEKRKATPYWEPEKTTPELFPRAKRHREFMQTGVPLEFRSRKNPYPPVKMAIRDGARLYGQHCASCHGPRGAGEGEASRDLAPPPAFLAYLIKRPRSVDEYLLWTISEGGAPFGSEMPSFKDKLTDRQIWQIVSYMRADFPDVAESGPD